MDLIPQRRKWERHPKKRGPQAGGPMPGGKSKGGGGGHGAPPFFLYDGDVTNIGTYYSSTIYGAGYEADHAADADGTTQWTTQSGSFPHWWAVYLGGKKYRVKTLYLLQHLTQYSSTFKLQGSDDSTDGSDGTWTDIQTISSGVVPYFFVNHAIANTVGYKWYRLYFESGATSYNAIWELAMFTDSGVGYLTDLLTGGTAYADSEYSGSYLAAYASNDSHANQWQSAATFPHWWAYDMGSQKTFNLINIRQAVTSFCGTFKIQGSNNSTDGSDGDWTDISTETTGISDKWTWHQTDPVTYQWVRVYATSGNHADYWAIVQIEVMRTIP